MPLFRSNGQLHFYAHVPKAGGSTVEDMLTNRFGSLAFLDRVYQRPPPHRRWSRSSPQHIFGNELSSLFPDDWVTSSFAVVRHPLTRVVSAYHYAFASERVPPRMTAEGYLDRAIRRMRSDIGAHDRHLWRQTDFVPEDAVVFRLEDGLDKVAAWLDETFGVTGADVPEAALKHGSFGRAHPDQRDYVPVSQKLVDTVASYYKADFDRFGYTMDDPVVSGLKVLEPRRGAYPAAELARMLGHDMLDIGRITAKRAARAVGRTARMVNLDD